MAERFKAAVLKTVGSKGPVGSNPTPSANVYFSEREGVFFFVRPNSFSIDPDFFST